MYKNYYVQEEIIHDYEYPETALVLVAPCGCSACEERVQPGHECCSSSPEDLRDDLNVMPRLEGRRWFWEYIGPRENVDEWLEWDDDGEGGDEPDSDEATGVGNN